MRVSTQVQVSNKEIRDAVIDAAKKVAGVNEPGSASVQFSVEEPGHLSEKSQGFSAIVEFVKAGH